MLSALYCHSSIRDLTPMFAPTHLQGDTKEVTHLYIQYIVLYVNTQSQYKGILQKDRIPKKILNGF